MATKKKKVKTVVDDQKPKRVFGDFQCSKCNRTWSSANTWTGMRQKCKICKIYVSPHKTNPLRRGNTDYNKEKHPEELCEMCIKLRHSCKN
ncbi:zinc finger CCHC domain-containing protein 24-like [Anneissia japonica]|uniref:zinc finger CCHC domain-containing protein 24-like n=1 Tax=Anneissia japonica TaxID=1529436 RepID=UPI00142558C0|nr:zinc finger CCHC domain-containing protein 24-like [Anneissia japonica]